MKRILTILILFSSSHVQAQADTTEAQSDSVEIKIVELPDSTAIGAPDGKLVSKEIDSSGGTIASDDRRVELIFPAGALTTPTTISIQPIVNLIPNGNGKGYRFEPSGLHFTKPVVILFHYTERDEEACPAWLHFMAVQDGAGKLQYMEYDDWDSAGKTLAGQITHFSAFLDGNEVELTPHTVDLKVRGTFTFSLNKVQAPKDQSKTSNKTDDNEDNLPPLPTMPVGLEGKESAVWYVNKIVGGNGLFGSIKRQNANGIQGNYTAPNALPFPTYVTVKLEVNVYIPNKQTIKLKRSPKGQKFLSGGDNIGPLYKKDNLATLTATVQLYDEFKVNVNMDFGKGEDMEWIDNSSFTLKVSDHVDISDIQNMMLKVMLRGKCKPIYVNEATCIGMINVKGIQSSNLGPANVSGNGPTMVNISFQPAGGPMVPSFDFSSCPNAKGRFASVPAVVAFPVRLSFQTKHERQVFSLGKGNGAPVKKADPEDITAIVEPLTQ